MGPNYDDWHFDGLVSSGFPISRLEAGNHDDKFVGKRLEG